MKRIKTEKGHRIFIIFYLAVLLLCAAFIFIRLNEHPVVVSGESMMPTYRNGQLLATHELDDGGPKIGDVIVFYLRGEFSTTRLIKRVVALPGDTIQIQNDKVYRNGRVIQEDFPLMEDPGFGKMPHVVPENSCFVLGDNRNHSSDSRVFGYVQYDDIFGVVDRKLFSLRLK